MLALIFVALAGIIHVYIFCLESLLWGRPRTNRTFGVSAEVAGHNRLFAFNQGFYNLFLALAAVGGAAVGLENPIGCTLAAYGLTSMLLAALVLFCSNRKLWRASLVQGLPAFVGLLFLALSLVK